MTKDMILDPVPRVLLSENIYDAMRLGILNGTFSPRERLSELDLSKRFGTSQGPVREALHRLGREGLVSRISHRGTFVGEVTEKEIAEMSKLRIALESVVIERFIRRAKPDDIIALKQLVEAMKMAATEGKLGELVENDMLFHKYICKVSGSLALAMWSAIEGKMRLTIATMDRLHQQNVKQIAELHQSIVDAIAAGNVAETLRLNRNHIKFVLGEIIDNE